MIFVLIASGALGLALSALALLLTTSAKGNDHYFEFVWRFDKWAKRPVYQVEYFGLPWEYENNNGKKGEFKKTQIEYIPTYLGSNSYHYNKKTEVTNKMKWRQAPYPPTEKLQNCGHIQAHSQRLARWEFKHYALFKQNPYLEYRVTLVEPGILKSAKKQQELEAQSKIRTDYRQAYIAHLEEELQRIR